MQELRECKDSYTCSDQEDADNHQVLSEVHASNQVRNGSHYEFVLSEYQQDEASGNAGQDHCADGDSTAEENEP